MNEKEKIMESKIGGMSIFELLDFVLMNPEYIELFFGAIWDRKEELENV